MLEKVKNIHFTGIKGVGMTALALWAQDMGKEVCGSDVDEDFVTSRVLNQRNIPISVGFKEEALSKDIDLLIYSAAHSHNPQTRSAKAKNIKALSYAQALAVFTQKKETIACCGVGGKSTSAAMIASILNKANLHPSYIVGVGNISNLGVPGRYDKGTYAVIEADEYVSVPGIDSKPKFLYLTPKIIHVTNIEYDHPDVYGDLEDTKEQFKKFFLKLPKDGLLIANIDSRPVVQLIKQLTAESYQAEIVTYGFSPQADWRIFKDKISRGKTGFKVDYGGIDIRIALAIPGWFNAANATASMIAATHLGVSQKTSVQALEQFQGTQRRFEKIGEVEGIEVWDDYAHHPKEIEATLQAARSWFAGKKITVVFQPHTYSRTKALLEDFSRSLSLADKVIITDIYASAREKKDPTISAAMLANRTLRYQKNTKFVNKDSVIEYLESTSGDQDVVIMLGAGDIYKLGELWAESQ